ncbi:N-acetylglucosamine-6-phosphate deacetylase [Arthrobacter crusticola]|uniref:N-acetylglucosamine-6-phosphate deacetylase n=1 Tax=Arthrobacter crusticola TaxID=2547960 RepID=A0A4R5TZ61_9MICC|nr:N-acetylglucosamine-6-phosphate deacetylase [Arthrobacter crusticola]TDK26557.1 N-acetylglucosamine-6-phosphate deacetylase [Arthrobacter crusticola]
MTFHPATQPLVLHSARRFTGTTLVPDAWLRVESGVVTDVGTGDSWRGLTVGAGTEGAGPEAGVLDAAGAYVAPGFVDLHCHGGGGASFEDGDISPALRVHRAAGTTSLLASLVTNPLPVLEASLRSLGAVRDPMLRGFHLEGPFLATSHCGAHRPDYLVAPTVEAVDRLVEAGGGSLVQVTMAPELDPDLAALRRFVHHGVRVAVGHTAADYETALRAFDAGASLLTHTFNAMEPLHHRKPGPIAAALDSPHVTLELIADGLHVHDPMVRLAFASAPGRVALITDAMAAAGAGDGQYTIGSLDVTVADGEARLAGNGSIAGSTLTLDAAVRRAVAAGVGAAEAVAAATLVPARALGLPGYGTTEVGARGGVVLLDEDLKVLRVLS